MSEVFTLPSGWSIDHMPSGLSSTIQAPQTPEHSGGGVTIYWKQRGFSLGYGGRVTSLKPYTGHGWKFRIQEDACSALKAALWYYKKTSTP